MHTPEDPIPPSIKKLASRLRLDVLSLLGQGGMGVVYKVHQRDLGRFAALKVIRADRNEETEFSRRFDREAQAMARMSHPNIVSVYDHGAAEGGSGLHYLLMEFVDGLTLRQLMNTGLDEVDCNRLMIEVCGATAYAHRKGIVHRDIKPENLLIGSDGAVKVVDFGLARFVDHDQSRLTQTQQVLGTIGYIAPEAFKGAALDERADVFALGAMLYELLTGEVPLGSFAPPSEKAGTDPRLDAVILKATAGDPEGRYPSVEEFATDLEECWVESGAAGGLQSQMPGPSTVLEQVAGAVVRFVSPAHSQRQNKARTVVAIHKTRLEEGDLPNICMVCGTHTRKRVVAKFHVRPQWALGGVVLSLILCFPIGITIAALASVNVGFTAPLCGRHRRHWSTLAWFSGLGWIPAGVIAARMVAMPNANGTIWPTAFAVACVAYIVPLIWLSVTRIGIAFDRGRHVTFDGVSVKFAERL